ncbi:DTW domain-containing protein [Nibricoccus aquaticus]|uniref:tRNA-uridine aminocarboxypropyltransferase n=1 Tax=Nibricoccus aquaticus TaxID=2576891 RepID=A0A290Q3U4_9BACT|nr:tRNA-uridine aminocarboxypropyltransferase [Nibricoccus aquaticus]ATC62967.1 DTW domain-containing protein [Nibricoccus aquaticus]
MARSVVLKGTVRCPRCQQAPRWCICAGLRTLETPLAIDILMHADEVVKPTSTGHLIQRTIPASRRFVWRYDRPVDPATVRLPGRELWILHPAGDPPPANAAPARIQLLLLDGSWAQAGDMSRAINGWGRRVSLPMSGKSRYLLRSQQNIPGRFSTVEALMFLLHSLGLRETHATLQLQFELHVYAGLRGRGRLAEADAYLADSPIRAAFPDLLASLDRSRPRLRPPENPPDESGT